MRVARTGKIARLPPDIRDEVNRRLHEGQRGRDIVDWLNSLPEVRAIMEQAFRGRPLREQNLSEWRCGGYQDWCRDREGRAMTSTPAPPRSPAAAPDLPSIDPDTLGRWVAAHYARVAYHVLSSEQPDDVTWQKLRHICHDIVRLRRADHDARRLELELRRASRRSRRFSPPPPAPDPQGDPARESFEAS